VAEGEKGHMRISAKDPLWWETPEVLEFARSYLSGGEGKTGVVMCDACLTELRAEERHGLVAIDEVIKVPISQKSRRFVKHRRQALKSASCPLDVCPSHMLPKTDAVFYRRYRYSEY